MPELGDVGAMDPAGDADVEGADQRNTGTESRAGTDFTGSDTRGDTSI
jgi:hypothetical protein